MRRASHRPILAVLPLLCMLVLAAPATAQTISTEPTASTEPTGATGAATGDIAPSVEPPVLTEPLGEVDRSLYQGSGDRDLRAYRPAPLAIVSDRDELVGTDRFAIVLRPDGIELVRGAETVRMLARPAIAYTLPEIAEVIADERWIEEVEDGVYLLKAALVHGPDIALTVGGPDVREVRLADRPDVFIGGADGAKGRIVDTHVVGWDERTGGPDVEYELSRPFILYTNGSSLDVENAEVSYLGYDRVGAYGLSWREGGATGSVVDSDVHHLFFGMYSFEGDEIRLADSRWYDNVYYGIDPHDATTLVIEGNEAYDNGSHGVILSRHVDDAVVRDNVSRDNAGNGIVLDFESNRALVEGNTVSDNGGDGIVILGSSDALVRDNVVTGHRVGVRVNLPSRNNRFVGNLIEDNGYGAQLYDGARNTTFEENVIRDSTDTGIVADAAGTLVSGGVISGTGVGIDARGIATAEDVEILDTVRGVEIRPTGIFTGRELVVGASSIGVQVAPGGIAALHDSAIEAPDPIAGSLDEAGNQLAQPPSTLWLVWAGAAFMVIAVVLQLLHRVRNRRAGVDRDGVVAPPGVTNAR